MQWRLGRSAGQFVAVTGTGSRRRRHRLGTDRAEAERQLHKLNNPKPQYVTVEWLWGEYVREKEGRAVIETMHHTWKALGPCFGHQDPEAITHEQCVGYIQQRQGQNRSDGTIHTELGHLRTVLRWGLQRRHISRANHITRPGKPPPKERHITQADAKRLIAEARAPHVRLAIVLMLGTAARVRAILDLTWDRVDFDRGLIYLRDPEDRTRRKGRATVPMNDMVRDALVEAKHGALTRHVIEWAGKPVGSLKKGMATAAKAARLEGVSAHVLRHSAAVWMAEAGVPMEEIAQYLGHSDINVTRRIYARFSPSYLRKAADVLDLVTGKMNRRRA